MRKFLSTAAAVGVLLSNSLTPAAFAVDYTQLPVFDTTNPLNRNVDVTTKGAKMNVLIGTQSSVGEAHWNSFSVGREASVNFEFSQPNQTSLNYVNQAGGVSYIYGKLTNSGCYNCGNFADTSKVILINPNGIAFGPRANVNLNSFTASTLNGTYDEGTNTLKLERGTDSKGYGIIVEGPRTPEDPGAHIHGDKGVNLIGDKLDLYQGSKITTNVGLNVDTNNDGVLDAAYGKVKLVTGDGVNFKYASNQVVEEMSPVTESSKKMLLYIKSDITAGNITAVNSSKDAASDLNIKYSTLKAVKAEQGNDGNIWLLANNQVVTAQTTLQADGNIKVETIYDGTIVDEKANGRISLDRTVLDAAGKTELTSKSGNVVVNNTEIKSPDDIKISAGRIASVQGNAVLTAAGDINITGKKAQSIQSTLTADGDIKIVSSNDIASAEASKLTAGKDINIISETSYVTVSEVPDTESEGEFTPTNSKLKAAGNINLIGAADVTQEYVQYADLDGKKIKIQSTEGAIALDSIPTFHQENGDLTLKAAKNITVRSDADDFAVSNVTFDAQGFTLLNATNGNLTIGDKVNFVDNDSTETTSTIRLVANKDLKTAEDVTLDLNGMKTTLFGDESIDVTIKNAANRDRGIKAGTNGNMKITVLNDDGTKGALSVSSLISMNDMTIDASTILKGKEYMEDSSITAEGYTDEAESRSYISVGGKFTAPDFEIQKSEDPDANGDILKHHIKFTSDLGDEEMLLENQLNLSDEEFDGFGDDGNPDFAGDVNIADPTQPLPELPSEDEKPGSGRDPITPPTGPSYGEGSMPESEKPDPNYCENAAAATTDVLTPEIFPTIVPADDDDDGNKEGSEEDNG